MWCALLFGTVCLARDTDYDRLSDFGRRQAQVTGARWPERTGGSPGGVRVLTRARQAAESVLPREAGPRPGCGSTSVSYEYDHAGFMALSPAR